MRYKMEELLPVVESLIRKYAGWEHSSVTYEKAEQLMGAVVYCIQEYESAGESSLVPEKRISAPDAYESGYELVAQKAKKAVALYNETSETFQCCGIRCLNDTFREGIPEFFQRYDPRFDPQNTILTLDYPVLENLQDKNGIDRIYAYLECIALEQRLLRRFPYETVTGILKAYHNQYEELFENICHIVLMDFTGRQMNVRNADIRAAQDVLRTFVVQYADNDAEILEYLMNDASDILAYVHIKTAPETPDESGISGAVRRRV